MVQFAVIISNKIAQMIIINYNKSVYSNKHIICPSYKMLECLVQLSTHNSIIDHIYKTIVINIEICSKIEMMRLNQNYRKKHYPTNVISLEYPIADNYLTGDIFLCHEIIKIEAKRQRKKLIDHYCHLIVHGLLHLQGFDHIVEHDAINMESTEIQILKLMGINNPYIIK
jgi:probable rRNA maturation factor